MNRERYLELLDEQDRLLVTGDLAKARALNETLSTMALKFSIVTRDAAKAGSLTPPAVAPPAAGPSSTSLARERDGNAAPATRSIAGAAPSAGPSRDPLSRAGGQRPRCRNCGGRWNRGADLLCEPCWETQMDLRNSWREAV